MRRRMILFGVLATLALSALSATSAAAAAAHRPDGWVRLSSDHLCGGNGTFTRPWKGQDIYNTTALNQKDVVSVGGASCDGDYYTFTVTIQNDGASDRFKVKGGGAYAPTKYFKGTTNITSQVKAGTYETASLAAGATTTIKVRVLPNYAEAVLVTLTSVADPTKKDAVKAGLKDVGCGC